MAVTRKAAEQELDLPKGFRFHPTDEELVLHYLCPKAESQPFSKPIIADVDIYKFDPWNLPEKAVHGESEWYFFSPRDRKYPNGSRPNRAAGSGYWKATGTDKHINCVIDGADGSPKKPKKLGIKKALVFYTGRAPNGTKTNWIMHEYRLYDGVCASGSPSPSRRIHRKGSLRLDDWVLCRIYKKKRTTDNESLGTSCNAKSEEERMDSSSANDNGVDSSSMEDVLAFLPEIESSKLNQLHLLPKLEEHHEHHAYYPRLVEQDVQSTASPTGSAVIDYNPRADFDDSSHHGFIDNSEYRHPNSESYYHVLHHSNGQRHSYLK